MPFNNTRSLEQATLACEQALRLRRLRQKKKKKWGSGGEEGRGGGRRLLGHFIYGEFLFGFSSPGACPQARLQRH